jgi:hypothetical protein
LNCDVTSEAENLRTRGQATVGALALIIDAKDQVPRAGPPIEHQLAVEVFGGPEADDLEEPSPSSIAAVPQQKSGKGRALPAAAGSGSRTISQSRAARPKARANRSSILLS